MSSRPQPRQTPRLPQNRIIDLPAAKEAPAWAPPATRVMKNISGQSLLSICRTMSESYGGQLTICASFGGCCTPLAGRVFACRAFCPKVRGTHYAKALGWRAYANSWLFLAAQASMCRAAPPLYVCCASATSLRIFHTLPVAALAVRLPWQIWRAATAYQTAGCGRY